MCLQHVYQGQPCYPETKESGLAARSLFRPYRADGQTPAQKSGAGAKAMGFRVRP
jgi:hypothetical protein